MRTVAVVFEEPERLALRELELALPGDDDVLIDVEWSGISTGTERLLWSGRMPPFPGLGYPLVPGYETVGRVVSAGARTSACVGERVFVPGAARAFGAVRGLFGGAAKHLVVPAERITPLDASLGEEATLLALAATAHHAIGVDRQMPDLIVGHGVLGRLVARLVVQAGGSPTVWEAQATRRDQGAGYRVIDPMEDRRTDYRCICDVSGDASLLDNLIARLARNGEIVLAGFYDRPVAFAFPPAFMREARLRIAAEWLPADLLAVRTLVETGRLSLAGLISHRTPASRADAAYRTAFGDPSCLKMILDWRN